MSKHNGNSRHRRLVSGVLAAALALTSVISTGSLANLNSKLAASVVAYEMTDGAHTGGTTCLSGQWWDTASSTCKSSTTGDCTAMGGTWDGTACKFGSTTTLTTTDCTNSGGTWDTATSSCKFATGTTTTTTTSGTTCPTGQWWDTVSSTCKSSTTTTTGTVPTVGDCTNSGGTWDAATSSCKFGTATTTTTTTSTVPTVGDCTNSGGTWDAATSSCKFGGITTNTSTTGTVPTVDSCTSHGGTWDAATSSCKFGTGTTTATPLFVQPESCGEGQYFDFMAHACVPFQKTGDQFFNQDYYSNFQTQYDGHDFECPSWDVLCQHRKDNKDQFVFGDGQKFGWEQDFECLSASKARIGKNQVEKDLAQAQKAFSMIDLAHASDSPVVAEARAQLEKLEGLDLSDPCAAGKAQEAMGQFFHDGGIMDQFTILSEISRFRDSLIELQARIESARDYITSDEAVALLDRAAVRTQEIYDNPELNPERAWEMWQSIDPPCMNADGRGGPNPVPAPVNGLYCSTVEELVEGETPLGLLLAAERLTRGDTDEFINSVEICGKIRETTDSFRTDWLSTLSATVQAELAPLFVRRDDLADKCETAENRRVIMDKLQEVDGEMRDILAAAGVTVRWPYESTGVTDLLGNNLHDQIQKMIDEKFAELEAKFEAKLEVKLQEAIAKVEAFFETEITKLAQTFNTALAQAFTTVANALSESAPELASALTETLSLDLFVSEGGEAVAEARNEAILDTIQSCEVLLQLDPDVEEAVRQIEGVLTGELIPAAVAIEASDQIDAIVTMAENGEDVSDELEELHDGLVEVVADENALTAALVEEGTWPYFDVPADPDLWYASEIAEAFDRAVATGTEVTVDGVEGREFNPDQVLNTAEGLAMIAKTLDIEPSTTISAEVDAWIPDYADWAEGYVQGLANVVGLPKIREVFEETGGASSPMTREQVVEVVVAAVEAEVGVISITADQIRHYDDFSEVESGGVETVHAFAVANALGAVQGQNDGKLADPFGEFNRAQAAKVLSTIDRQMELYRNVGELDILNPEGEHVGTYSAEKGISIGNPEGN